MFRKFLVLSVVLCTAVPLFSEPHLYMAEEDGCYWCGRWNEEIGEIYPKNREGKTAKLIRYDLHNDDPDVDFKMNVNFTPTFILVDEGKELGRIEGYPGEDFFWGLLGMLFEQADIALVDDTVKAE